VHACNWRLAYRETLSRGPDQSVFWKDAGVTICQIPAKLGFLTCRVPEVGTTPDLDLLLHRLPPTLSPPKNVPSLLPA